MASIGREYRTGKAACLWKQPPLPSSPLTCRGACRQSGDLRLVARTRGEQKKGDRNRKYKKYDRENCIGSRHEALVEPNVPIQRRRNAVSSAPPVHNQMPHLRRARDALSPSAAIGCYASFAWNSSYVGSACSQFASRSTR